MSNRMDGNMIQLYHGFLRPGDRQRMYASSLKPGTILHALRSVFGVLPRDRPSGKKRQVLHLFGPAGRTRGSRELPSDRQLQVYKSRDPRARYTGPTRWSAENNSRVILNRPAKIETLLTRPDTTRPVTFQTPPDPTRPDSRHFQTFLTRRAGRVMTHEKP